MEEKDTVNWHKRLRLTVLVLLLSAIMAVYASYMYYQAYGDTSVESVEQKWNELLNNPDIVHE
ncbi:MAG: hypothetical protein ABIG66_05555 [Candidatus Kerfeldbacteria bacterium]